MSESSTDQPRVDVPETTEAEVPAEPKTETVAADAETTAATAAAEAPEEAAAPEAAPAEPVAAEAAPAASEEPPAAAEEAPAATQKAPAATQKEPAATKADTSTAEAPAVEAAEVEAATSEGAPAEAQTAPDAPKSAEPKPKKKKKTPGAPTSFAASMAPAVMALQELMESKTKVTGKVIGWNKGGFHVVCEGVTAFCPNSEMGPGKLKAPKDYLDQTYEFSVLRIEDNGRRVVLSRGKSPEGARADESPSEPTQKRIPKRQKIEVGAEIEGKIASLTKFGAFVDVGGVQGLVHVSEISRSRVEDPAQVLSVGQQVKVKVLKVEQGGKRISLSMKALAPDPWKGVADRFPEGSVVQGTVERTAKFGAFIALEPGLTGLLPASVLSLPRDASINRMYHPGKQLSVMVMSVDPRRRRISLALEGSQSEGSRSDFESYKKTQQVDTDTGFNALAAAFQKVQQK